MVDSLLKALNFLLNKELQHDAKCQALIIFFTFNCFIVTGIIWRRIKWQVEPSCVVFLSHCLISDTITKPHGDLLSGHDGIYNTKECLLQMLHYWPSMNADIGAYLKACHCCQVYQQDQCQPPALLSPMLQTTKHNQHIHADLFGPLKTSDNDEKFIFITVGLFNCWICHFGVPLNLITDQGTEFCKTNLAKIFFNGWALHT